MGHLEKWMWGPILGFMMGGAIPLFFVDFVEESWQDRIWSGMSPVMALFTYSLFKRIRKMIPVISKWALESHVGISLFVFLGMLIASSAGVLFALLPVPHWLHLFFGLCLALAALPLLVHK